MKTKYRDLIAQSYQFPQEEFSLHDHSLSFHGVDMMKLIAKYGAPLKFTYLPKISENIQHAQKWFAQAISKHRYGGDYYYCYCTKSSHFKHVVEETLRNDVHIETSSAFDIDIVERLLSVGKINSDHFVICNGFKQARYIQRIAKLINGGYGKCIPIIDNFQELGQLTKEISSPFEVGIRIASEEEPKFEFYTSRLGIGYKDVVPFFEQQIKGQSMVKLKMLHFFINTGIRDTAYYWGELHKCLSVYVQLKQVCPSLNSLNIGGGFPIKNSLSFDFDYGEVVDEIVKQIKAVCTDAGVEVPHLFTEFGSYTVGESGGAIYEVLDQKKQNDREKWNMINSSFITTLPDTWAINKRFILLAINRWDSECERVLLGGLTCDSDDYYNSEQHRSAIDLPLFDKSSPLYIGFFHTGAYQETLGGFGGVQHCLMPQPKHILIQREQNGDISTSIFSQEQSSDELLSILGYGDDNERRLEHQEMDPSLNDANMELRNGK